MPALLLLTGPSAGRRYEVVTQLTLGRSPSCDIPLEDDQVSRRHAQLFLDTLAGQVRLRDLGSTNGTLLNGQRLALQEEAVLRPGDRMRVGATIAVFEPPPVSIVDEPSGMPAPETGHVPIEEVLPHVGAAAAMYSAGTALLGATSEAMVLRRLAEESAHALNADRTAALLSGPEGLRTAVVSGAASVEVPRALVQAALERKELGRADTALCAPLVASGGMPFGVLYVEREESPFTEGEGQLLASLGRLGGEAYTAVRSRGEAEAAEMPWVTPLGTSRAFRGLVEEARRAAGSAAPVVLHGEPGTGKALLGRFLHGRSPRALGPWVTVECRQTLEAVEVALFGRAGAAGQPPVTSAVLRADAGTLLLRHVDALPRAAAERLARMLARRAAPARQGGEEPVDVRVVATSSAPVSRLASRGEFDAALARGLTGFELEVPPLRERRGDVPVLLEYFALRAARQSGREAPVLGPEARRLLAEYPWPQNVRELELVAERLGRVYAAGHVGIPQLPPEVREGAVGQSPRTLQEQVARLERDAIAEALRESGWKKVRAAELLGISRPTLDRKMDEYGLTLERGPRG
ncbi:FHA domain-containing protein [Corallococcus sp. CA053C]|uniref:FHA domain-containing protein n=1 Tax=Corallococcus sp. CA053C TaxID=2316732 RepID=UPI000EA1685F|nr:FHA domain-containing protein [Corallococcus sp. CA053C]RKG95147.1 FHA domain-containing protein [Corallococcus sp. CA053C]